MQALFDRTQEQSYLDRAPKFVTLNLFQGPFIGLSRNCNYGANFEVCVIQASVKDAAR